MCTLRSQEILRFEHFIPGADVDQAKVAAIHDLVLQPRRPWFSEAEQAHLREALAGRLGEVAGDHFFVAWSGDEPVGNVYYGTAAAAPQIGLLAYVITQPAHRDQGIGTLLARKAVEHFVAGGGVCLHLGTANPVARRTYERCGFRAYNGHVMRYLAPGWEWQGFDDAYFADEGPAQVRPGHWGDLARVGMLYTAPSRWFVKDYPERLYSHPALLQTRCGSIPASMLLNATQQDGGLWVLENPRQRIVGAATATRLDGTAQAHVPLLDFLVVPAYCSQAPALLAMVIESLGDKGAERLRVYLASQDMEKAGIVRQVGFRCEATLVEQFRVGDDHYDLQIYTRCLKDLM